MNYLNALWKFSRPHTIVGSVLSISALYCMVCNSDESEHLFILFLALVTGITCNLYIVGINQIADIDIDKINKPHLPLASGELSVKQARVIVYSSALLCLLIALVLSPLLLMVVSVSMGIGWAYSCPPLYLRKHHLPAALSIAVVRGLMVNVGAYLVFYKLIYGEYQLHIDIIILSVFVLVFSIVIAWFKDLPDMKGDAQYKIKSLALMTSQKFTLNAGKTAIILAYLFAIVMYSGVLGVEKMPLHAMGIMSIGHSILLLAFVLFIRFSKENGQAAMKKFYKIFWFFFFAEYLLTFIAYII